MSFLAPLPRLRDFRRAHFHDLRHSHATELYSQASIGRVAQERLGHPTVNDDPGPLEPGDRDDAGRRYRPVDAAFCDVIKTAAGRKRGRGALAELVR